MNAEMLGIIFRDSILAEQSALVIEKLVFLNITCVVYLFPPASVQLAPE